MRYHLYLAPHEDGMALILTDATQPRPHGQAQLVRTFSSREKALAAIARLQEEFVFGARRCAARAEATA
jgi:hypothetical protein